MDEDMLCLGCMKLNRGIEPCPMCGFDEKVYLEKMGKKVPLYLSLGTMLAGDRYIVGKVIGQGNFGITYAGLDTQGERRVIIKEYMPRSLAYRSPNNQQVLPFNDENRVFFAYGLQQFLKEAGILAGLTGEAGIIEVYQGFQQNNTGYMIMEYLEGRTLEVHLQYCLEPLTWEEAMDIIYPVLDSLKKVHQAGWLHRDISPDNIFMCTSGATKLYDFGGARQALIDQNKQLSVVLKPGYVPLENYITKGHRGPWTDIYALCATLFRMVTGMRIPEATVRVENDTVPQRLAEAAAIPAAVQPIMLKALAVRPEDRYADTSVFEQELLSAAGYQPPAGEASTGLEPLALPSGGLELPAGIQEEPGQQEPAVSRPAIPAEPPAELLREASAESLLETPDFPVPQSIEKEAYDPFENYASENEPETPGTETEENVSVVVKKGSRRRVLILTAILLALIAVYVFFGNPHLLVTLTRMIQ